MQNGEDTTLYFCWHFEASCSVSTSTRGANLSFCFYLIFFSVVGMALFIMARAASERKIFAYVTG